MNAECCIEFIGWSLTQLPPLLVLNKLVTVWNWVSIRGSTRGLFCTTYPQSQPVCLMKFNGLNVGFRNTLAWWYKYWNYIVHAPLLVELPSQLRGHSLLYLSALRVIAQILKLKFFSVGDSVPHGPILSLDLPDLLNHIWDQEPDQGPHGEALQSRDQGEVPERRGSNALQPLQPQERERR